jgi:hypothetical protein
VSGATGPTGLPAAQSAAAASASAPASATAPPPSTAAPAATARQSRKRAATLSAPRSTESGPRGLRGRRAARTASSSGGDSATTLRPRTGAGTAPVAGRILQLRRALGECANVSAKLESSKIKKSEI